MMTKSFSSCLTLLLMGLPILTQAQNCSITTTPINFGSYHVFSASQKFSTSYLRISCDAPVSYNILLNQGLHGTYDQRLMQEIGGSDQVKYNLYTDASCSIIWGSNVGNTSSVSGTAPAGSTQIQVYACAPAGQDVDAGSYEDEVSVTLSY